ncbi:hypothetical protein TNCV_4925361 [Trichonephila clavipes]|nr:hypothetical protein TNCV_4925361 [Trichonephila clavipes]
MTLGLQEFPWTTFDQHMASIGTKAELAAIGKNNRFPPRPPMSSCLTPLASPTAMAWSQWNTRYSSHVWFRANFEVADSKQFVLSIKYQLLLEFIP